MTMTREELARDHDSGASASARERERRKERRIRGTGGVSDRRMRAGAFETRRAFSPTPAARVARSVVHGRLRGVYMLNGSRRPESPK